MKIVEKMEKFKVLKRHEFVLNKLGFNSKHSQSETNVFFKSFASYYILINCIIFEVSCLFFIYQNASDFNVVLRTSFHFLAVYQVYGMFFCYGINIDKIWAVHFKLQELTDRATGGLYDLKFYNTKIKLKNENSRFLF